ADFSFRSEFFAVFCSHIAGFAEGLGNEFGIVYRVDRPGFGAGCRVDANHAVRADPDLTELLTKPARGAHLFYKTFPLFAATHCGATGRGPDGRYQASD